MNALDSVGLKKAYEQECKFEAFRCICSGCDNDVNVRSFAKHLTETHVRKCHELQLGDQVTISELQRVVQKTQKKAIAVHYFRVASDIVVLRIMTVLDQGQTYFNMVRLRKSESSSGLAFKIEQSFFALQLVESKRASLKEDVYPLEQGADAALHLPWVQSKAHCRVTELRVICMVGCDSDWAAMTPGIVPAGICARCVARMMLS